MKRSLRAAGVGTAVAAIVVVGVFPRRSGR